MKIAMTIGVRVDRRYAKYDQFDPLCPDVQLFHEDCAGGALAICTTKITIEGAPAWKVLCKACGTGSPPFPRPDVRRALRAVVVGKRQEAIRFDEKCVAFIPITPSAVGPSCRRCGSLVDPETDEYAVLHSVDESVVYVHVDCSPAVKEEAPPADEARLTNLLHELREISRRQSEPIRRRGAK